VKDLLEINPGKFKTIRLSLPAYVKECLSSFYNLPNVSKGVFDLVIWRSSDCRIRFIEVKCPIGIGLLLSNYNLLNLPISKVLQLM